VSSSAPQQAAQPAPVQQPPPPPPKQLANQAPAKSSLGLSVQSRQRSGADEESNLDVAGPPSVAAAEVANNRKARQVQLAELMQRARAADNAGDLKQEYQLCDELLRSDAEGDLRAEGLYRMCNLLQRLGQEDQAQPYCSQLVAQFPSSKWAATAISQEKNRAAAPPKASKSKSYQRDEQYESPAPAATDRKSEPANSMHAF
jgi:hypothetical protein